VHRRWIGLAATALWLGLSLAGTLLTGCGAGQPPDGGNATKTPPAVRDRHIGTPRSFALGLSSQPSEPTSSSYEKAFAFAGQVGELIMIQRAPPWEEFVPGGTLSKSTQEATQREKLLAEENRLDIFLAIDPTDPADRGKLNLPGELQGKTFADETVRQAFIAYVKYMTLNYEPRYLALGVEVNMYFEEQPDDFANFVSLYADAYDAVKSISPETLVFPTFQLEAMENLLSPTGAGPEWDLLDRFGSKMDLVAFSTYPSFVFKDPESIPANYFSQIQSHTTKPIAIAAAGYSSGPERGGLNQGTEAQQATFLGRLLTEADQLNMAFVVWLAGRDPASPASPPFDLYDQMGLLHADGSAKPASQVWSSQAARPLKGGNPDSDDSSG
jgi:hypothetical protein